MIRIPCKVESNRKQTDGTYRAVLAVRNQVKGNHPFIDLKRVNTKTYMDNSGIVCWNHDVRTPPGAIGKTKNLYRHEDGRIEADFTFTKGDPRAAMIENAWAQGDLTHASISVTPPDKNGDYELLEWSVVAVAADREASTANNRAWSSSFSEMHDTGVPELQAIYQRSYEDLQTINNNQKVHKMPEVTDNKTLEPAAITPDIISRNYNDMMKMMQGMYDMMNRFYGEGGMKDKMGDKKMKRSADQDDVAVPVDTTAVDEAIKRAETAEQALQDIHMKGVISRAQPYLAEDYDFSDKSENEILTAALEAREAAAKEPTTTAPAITRSEVKQFNASLKHTGGAINRADGRPMSREQIRSLERSLTN